MNRKLVFWSVTVAIAGFLFGFDTVVISGANLPIKELWGTTPLFHGFFIMSMALWGTVIGALFAGVPSQRLGRKKTLIWIGVLFFVSALGSGLAWDPYSFSFFRFIGGLGVGASSVAAPVYITEISTEKNRGGLVALYQFNIVLGIFVAFFSNYLLKGFGGANDWRWMLGVEAIPAFIYTVMVFGVPKSPRWLLLTKGDEAGASAILSQIGVADVKAEILAIKESVKFAVKENIFVPKYRTPVILAFLLAFFNQLSGINFVLYYAPEILEKAGLAAKESLQSSISIGGINLVFTMIGMYLIDKMGRKQLMIIGSLGYIISLAMVAYAYATAASPTFLMTFLLAFIASHAIGQGAVIWVFISEIFPNRVRAFGQAWGSGIHWIFAALITLLGPVVINFFSASPWPIFAFFSGMMVLQLLFVLTMMPETKGVSLEELERRLIK
ncbi:MAG: sugar porter family MFS transporter [Saprospiraceae bacterium]